MTSPNTRARNSRRGFTSCRRRATNPNRQDAKSFHKTTECLAVKRDKRWPSATLDGLAAPPVTPTSLRRSLQQVALLARTTPLHAEAWFGCCQELPSQTEVSVPVKTEAHTGQEEARTDTPK
jgi:hypothetical protein